MRNLFLSAITALTLAFCAAQPAVAQTNVNLCTGSETGNYFRAGNIVAKKASGVKINVLTSKGSNENLDGILSGKCDAAFVQRDALQVYAQRNPRIIPAVEQGGVLYQEYLHLICNRNAKIDRITDLTSKHTVAIGGDGTGNRITWEGLVLADKKRYGAVNTDNRAGMRALSAVADGSDVQCMIYVAALRSSFMTNDVNSEGRVALIAADDSDLVALQDNKKNQIYPRVNIPSNTYRNIQIGTFGNSVNTIAVDALFVINMDWLNKNEGDYDRLVRAFKAGKNEISELVVPR